MFLMSRTNLRLIIAALTGVVTGLIIFTIVFNPTTSRRADNVFEIAEKRSSATFHISKSEKEVASSTWGSATGSSKPFDNGFKSVEFESEPKMTSQLTNKKYDTSAKAASATTATKQLTTTSATPLKTVMFWHGWQLAHHIYEGPMVKNYVNYTRDNCRHTCRAVVQYSSAQNNSEVDLVVFFYRMIPANAVKKYPGQVWLFRTGEPQSMRSANVAARYNGLFNYTQSFRPDSTHGIYFGKTFKKSEPLQSTNWTSVKLEKEGWKQLKPTTGWFLNNCKFTPSGRQRYVKNLINHINVTIRSNSQKCRETFGDYLQHGGGRGTKTEFKGVLFYLSFENSRCSDYITEKLWKILLTEWMVIPVVLGGGVDSLKEYKRIAPPNSYLHVLNFTTPADLAAHMKKIAADPTAYNYYHTWREKYYVQSGERLEDDAAKLCEMCELAQENLPVTSRILRTISQLISVLTLKVMSVNITTLIVTMMGIQVLDKLGV